MIFKDRCTTTLNNTRTNDNKLKGGKLNNKFTKRYTLLKNKILKSLNIIIIERISDNIKNYFYISVIKKC